MTVAVNYLAVHDAVAFARGARAVQEAPALRAAASSGRSLSSLKAYVAGQAMWCLSGIAATYGVPYRVAREEGIGWEAIGHSGAGGWEMLQAGCFSHRGGVRLLADHDADQYLASSAGDLTLRSSNRALEFSCLIPSGRRDLVAGLAKSRREMSVKFRPLRARQQRFSGRLVTVVESAELVEISMVGRGAVPGTSVRFG